MATIAQSYDSQSCIRCYACMVACGTENQARLQRDAKVHRLLRPGRRRPEAGLRLRLPDRRAVLRQPGCGGEGGARPRRALHDDAGRVLHRLRRPAGQRLRRQARLDVDRAGAGCGVLRPARRPVAAVKHAARDRQSRRRGGGRRHGGGSDRALARLARAAQGRGRGGRRRDREHGGSLMSPRVLAFSRLQIWFHRHLIHFMVLFVATGLPILSPKFSRLAWVYGLPLSAAFGVESRAEIVALGACRRHGPCIGRRRASYPSPSSRSSWRCCRPGAGGRSGRSAWGSPR
jgi:ferredoxin